jgi:hypothetical protein
MENFIRFKEKNYVLEDQGDCIANDAADACSNDEEYLPPTKPGDIINFVVDLTEVDLLGTNVIDLRIALVSCGVLVAANIGTIIDAGDQILCSATIPSNVADGECYEFVIYSIYDPIDCGDYAGSTLQDTIDANIKLGQVLGCTLNDFL